MSALTSIANPFDPRNAGYPAAQVAIEDIITPPIKLQARAINFRYGDEVALKNVTMPLYRNRITAIMGPSGCGKSTLLRTFNRMDELSLGQSIDGEILLDGRNILARGADLHILRARVGMVFQQPMPFPMSIYDNVAFGIRLFESPHRRELDARVKVALQKAALWDEVHSHLSNRADMLSIGQQQRLCIARAIALTPEVLLLDEPCSALDPNSAAKIERTIMELKADHTIAIVTHNLQQAARISDFAAFMFLGELVEFGPTQLVFDAPSDERTRNFVEGRYG